MAEVIQLRADGPSCERCINARFTQDGTRCELAGEVLIDDVATECGEYRTAQRTGAGRGAAD